MRTSVGLKEIAKEAGVSVMTVSFALNNRGHVSEKKRVEICDIAKRLGYSPSAAARILKSNFLPDLGLVIFETENLVRKNPAVQDTIIRFMAECRAKKRRFQIEWFDSTAHPNELPELFTNGLVGGLLVYGVASAHAENFLEKTHHPFVRLNVPGQYSVSFRHNKAMEDALDALVARGITDIGFINGPKNKFSTFGEYEQIFRNEMKKRNLPLVESRIMERPLAKNYQDGVDTLLRSLNRRPLPQAFFLSGDSYINGFLTELQKSGTAIPRNLKVICFEILGWQAEASSPALASIEYDMGELVSKALELLCHLMNGNKIPEKNLFAETRFIQRASIDEK